MAEEAISTEFLSLECSEIDLFRLLPRHNQMDVLKKLDFTDFIAFKQCSKETKEMTKNFRHRLLLKINYVHFMENSCGWCFVPEKYHELDCILVEPVRLAAYGFIFDGIMSNEQFKFLKEFCEKTKITAKGLCVNGCASESEPWMIDELIKLLNPKVLNTRQCSSFFLSSLQELKRVKRVDFNLGIMEESDLLHIKHPRIEMDGEISYSAINNFLKQWMVGERRIERFLIEGIDCETSEILKDLDFVLLSPPEADNTSYNERRIHSLTRNDGKKLCVEFAGNGLTAEEYETEINL